MSALCIEEQVTRFFKKVVLGSIVFDLSGFGLPGAIPFLYVDIMFMSAN